MKPKRTSSSYVLVAGFLALLIVGALFGYQIYSSLTRTQITERQQLGIAPIDGVISKETLDNLGGRRQFSQTDFNRLVFNSISQPDESSPSAVSVTAPVITPVSTASGTVSGVLQ